MRQSERVRGGAEGGGEQSREISRSITQNNPGSKARRRGETSPYFRKLNRQIPELKHPLSLGKQTTSNCSNRQKIQFCKNEISTQKIHASSRTSPMAEENDPRISNRELLGLEISQLVENKHPRPVLIANFEPNDFLVFQTGHSK